MTKRLPNQHLGPEASPKTFENKKAQKQLSERKLDGRYDDHYRGEKRNKTMRDNRRYKQKNRKKLGNFLSVAEYAKREGVSRQAILARINRGTLPAAMVGNYYVIKEDELKTKQYEERNKRTQSQ